DDRNTCWKCWLMPFSSLGTISHSFVILLDPIYLSECHEFLFEKISYIRHKLPTQLLEVAHATLQGAQVAHAALRLPTQLKPQNHPNRRPELEF
ncbi:hypothetical protein PIB30_092891, partial [Stylosanthes scabra]|nr:hypothetical protein [Stylosanthes scabra]